MHPATEAEQSRRLTFAHLARLEPRLLTLRNAVIARGATAYRKRNWCANGAWYGCAQHRDHGSLKDRLGRLVGWHRIAAPGSDLSADDEALLRSTAAYDCVYSAVYELLPPCRVCGCM